MGVPVVVGTEADVRLVLCSGGEGCKGSAGAQGVGGAQGVTRAQGWPGCRDVCSSGVAGVQGCLQCRGGRGAGLAGMLGGSGLSSGSALETQVGEDQQEWGDTRHRPPGERLPDCCPRPQHSLNLETLWSLPAFTRHFLPALPVFSFSTVGRAE